MSKKHYTVTLTADQCQQLQAIVNTGRHTAQQRKRAQVLLLANGGMHDPAIANDTGMSLGGIYQIRRRWCDQGFDACVTEKPRSGRPRTLSGHDEAALTALACSTPPDGRVRWTHRLLADRLVRLDIVEDIGILNQLCHPFPRIRAIEKSEMTQLIHYTYIAHTTVGRVLKKTISNPGSANSGALDVSPVST